MKTTQSPEQFEATHLEKLRAQLSLDIELLQQKEANMRDYEQRLRGLIAHTAPVQSSASPATSSSAIPAMPHYGSSRQAEAELDAAWDKYHRANALLEAARRGMVDDRLALRELDERLRLRESELSRRESWVRAREAELKKPVAAATHVEKPAAPRTKGSSLTAVPFMLAKNLLSPRRT